MLPTLLMIPTLDPVLARRCLDSLLGAGRLASVRAIAVYNGDDPSIGSMRYLDDACLIGKRHSDEIAGAMADAAGCPQELLFGSTAWGRSYGGASNLLLAIAWFLGPGCVAKVDDDCLDLRADGLAWLEAARAAVCRDPENVYFGRSLVRPSGEIGRLPVDVARRIGRIVYTRAQRAERVDGQAPAGATLKNGVLAFHTRSISRSCYAVLHLAQGGVHLRGEVYWWAAGFADDRVFKFSPELTLGHAPLDTPSLEGWVRSTLAGTDFWYLRRHMSLKGFLPSIDRRMARLRLIRAWLQRAPWPEGFDRPGLDSLMRDDVQLPFSDRIYAEEGLRRDAWRRLMQAGGRDRQAILEALSVASGPILPA